jgi:hypothetical protein
MEALSTHLRIAGALLLLLAAAHALFPRLFRWREELARLSLLNRQIFVVHDFFIALVVAMMGSVSLLDPAALLERARLGAWALGGLALFWTARLAIQLFVYDPSLWRGNGPRTVAHVAFTALWCYLAGVYGVGMWRALPALHVAPG